MPLRCKYDLSTVDDQDQGDQWLNNSPHDYPQINWSHRIPSVMPSIQCPGTYEHSRYSLTCECSNGGKQCGSEAAVSMMTSSNGSIFRVTGLLCGEFTGHRWNPLTKANHAELWYFLWSAPEQKIGYNRGPEDLRCSRARYDYDVTVMDIYYRDHWWCRALLRDLQLHVGSAQLTQFLLTQIVILFGAYGDDLALLQTMPRHRLVVTTNDGLVWVYASPDQEYLSWRFLIGKLTRYT